MKLKHHAAEAGGVPSKLTLYLRSNSPDNTALFASKTGRKHTQRGRSPAFRMRRGGYEIDLERSHSLSVGCHPGTHLQRHRDRRENLVQSTPPRRLRADWVRQTVQ